MLSPTDGERDQMLWCVYLIGICGYWHLREMLCLNRETVSLCNSPPFWSGDASCYLKEYLINVQI